MSHAAPTRRDRLYLGERKCPQERSSSPPQARTCPFRALGGIGASGPPEIPQENAAVRQPTLLQAYLRITSRLLYIERGVPCFPRHEWRQLFEED